MNDPSIAIIHTSPATVDLFGRLLREALPSVRVVNLLDDSILPELAANGGSLSAVLPRWKDYARIARDRGVDLILNACSSVGEVCAMVEPETGVPIVRVDAQMAREAVRRGARIAVVATLATTLRPTSDLLVETAEGLDHAVTIERVLVDGAYEALMRGDQAGHDDEILAALSRAAETSDVIVLAQASMARVVPRLSAEARDKVLSSPTFAVQEVLSRLSGRPQA
jgi:Asp/Glu/hydantoin racemase